MMKKITYATMVIVRKRTIAQRTRRTRYWNIAADSRSGGCPEESGVSLHLREPRPQLGARADAELAVDAGDVRLDGLRAHEQLSGDLAVRQAGGGELGDAALALGQVVGRA